MTSPSFHKATAPVALFVYKRTDHAEMTINALRENLLAKQTNLYIFSDGPKDDKDCKYVQRVRDFIAKVEGFASVTIIESEDNKGLANSITNGVTQVVNNYGRVIVIEDDLITHPLTLIYFNRMLDYYENYPGVFSISAYNHPPDIMPIPKHYLYDVFAIPRMQCWGWATWKDRWVKSDFSLKDFSSFNESISEVGSYSYWIGSDSLNTLRSCMRGEKDVWACKWVYTHFKHHAVCICPTQSLVNNIGFDGTGSNCGFSKKYEQSLQAKSVEKWRLPITAHVDPSIFERFMLVMDKNWKRDHEALGEGVSKKTARSIVIIQIKNKIKTVAKIGLRFFNEIKSFRIRNSWSRPISKINQSDAHLVSAEHKKISAESKANLVRLGTDYGGWWVPETGLSQDDFIVSAGAGEDISFDIELAKRYGCSILILDPTPRAAIHFKQTLELIKNNQPAPINNSESEFYRANAKDIEDIKFRPLGLWSENSIKHFFVPANPNNVSHSISNMHGTNEGFEAECVSLSEVLKLEGREKISVLKLDIEGAEFPVLRNLLEVGHKPNYILVEFHAGQDEIERLRRPKTIQILTDLHKVGYRVVKQSGWDYVLELQ